MQITENVLVGCIYEDFGVWRFFEKWKLVGFVVGLHLEVNQPPHLQEGVDSHERAYISRQMSPASYTNVMKLETHL